MAAKQCQHHTLFTNKDQFTCLQAMTVESLLYLQLGEQSRSMRTAGMASMLALELGMHRSTRRFNYGPLQAEMRKRVFWCIFLLDV